MPAGKIDSEGESNEECARRELQEETGYIAGNIKHIISINTTPGFTNEVIHIYVAEDLTRGEQSPDEDEFINVELYTPGEISHLIKDGDINDAKSLIGLLMAGVK